MCIKRTLLISALHHTAFYWLLYGNAHQYYTSPPFIGAHLHTLVYIPVCRGLMPFTHRGITLTCTPGMMMMIRFPVMTIMIITVGIMIMIIISIKMITSSFTIYICQATFSGKCSFCMSVSRCFS